MSEIQRRTLGMNLLSKGVPQAEVARRCSVSRQTALNWARRLSQGLPVDDIKPGPKPRLDEKTFQRFEKRLAASMRKGEHITLDSARELLKKDFGLDMSRAQIARILSGSAAPTPRQVQFKRNEIEILRTWADAAWQF
jgi:transposase